MNSINDQSTSMTHTPQAKGGVVLRMPAARSSINAPRKRRKKGNRLPPFVALTWEMLNSSAYKELPPSAAKALPYFLGKPKLPCGDPEYLATEFSLSYGEANRYGFASSTYSKIIQALMRMGFIDPLYKGGLRGGGLSTSVFTLSDRWRKYGQSAFQKVEWKQFLTVRRMRPTSVLAINHSNIGRKTAVGDGNCSQSEVVGAL